MYSKNPAYFDAPQTTYGVKRMGPVQKNPHCVNPVSRYKPMGMLSIDGKLIPAPLGAIQMGAYGGFLEDNKEMIKSVAIYGLGGFALGYAALIAYKRFM